MTSKHILLLAAAIVIAAMPARSAILERYYDTCKAKRLYAEYEVDKSASGVRKIAVPRNQTRGFVTDRPSQAHWRCGPISNEFRCPRRTRYIEIDRPLGIRFYVSCHDRQ